MPRGPKKTLSQLQAILQWLLVKTNFVLIVESQGNVVKQVIAGQRMRKRAKWVNNMVPNTYWTSEQACARYTDYQINVSYFSRVI